WLGRLAALARAKPRPLGVGPGRVKRDVLRPRGARGARRPAVHAGRPNGVEELAIRARVSGAHRRPSRIALHRSGERLALRRHTARLLSMLLPSHEKSLRPPESDGAPHLALEFEFVAALAGPLDRGFDRKIRSARGVTAAL